MTATRQVFVQGLIAGLVGYVAVAGFFFVTNIISGRSPFLTAAMLGASLFYGLNDPSQLVIAPGPVLAYNGLHLFLSLLAAFAAAWLVFEVERHHNLWYVAFFLFLAAFVFSVAVVGVVGAEILRVLPWWTAVAANVVWAAAVGVYLWLAHRSLFLELQAEQSSPKAGSSG